MIDIFFYMNAFDIKEQLKNGKISGKDAFKKFEECRRKEPVVYNIETTNLCNMKCVMCPRTTLMSRPIVELNMKTYEKVVDQIRPWSSSEWHKWENFVSDKYLIKKNEMSENHFFLYIIPRVIVLHGYGAPLLDKHIVERVKLLTDKGIQSYFSCNPANIKLDKTREIFKAGLNYIKFSIESVDDLKHKKIRGEASNFSDSYDKIIQLINENYDTKIVVTMLDLNQNSQLKEYENLVEKFRDFDNVYIYLKSQDCLWYNDTGATTNSIHWIEPCQFAWSSMTIKSDGMATQCVEDYNNDIVLGDANEDSLYKIWNGEKYKNFRKSHLTKKGIDRCTNRCDMKLLGDFN